LKVSGHLELSSNWKTKTNARSARQRKNPKAPAATRVIDGTF